MSTQQKDHLKTEHIQTHTDIAQITHKNVPIHIREHAQNENWCHVNKRQISEAQ